MNQFEQPLPQLPTEKTTEIPKSPEAPASKPHELEMHEEKESAEQETVRNEQFKQNNESEPSVETPQSLAQAIIEMNNPELLKSYEIMLREWKASQDRIQELEKRNTALTTEQAALTERNIELELNNAHLSTEINKLSFDNLTNLKNRSSFYKELNTSTLNHLESLLPPSITDWENASLEEIAHAFAAIDQEKLSAIPFSILNADGSGVSVANSESHSKGDELISLYGEASKKTMDQFDDAFTIFRYGGDEFTGIINESSPELTQKMANTFLEEINKKEFPYFAKMGLDTRLHMDIGIARFDEGVRAFIDLLTSILEHNEQETDITQHINLPPGKRMRTLLDLWMKIADERAIIKKAETRIEKLQEYRRKKPPVHKNIVDLLRKGALHITDETLNILPSNAEVIKFYVLETRNRTHNNTEAIPNSLTQLEKLSDKIIQENVIQKELTKYTSINYSDTLNPSE